MRLSLKAEPASVGVARQAVAALGIRIGVSEPTLGDVKTASRQGGELAIVVRDRGRGIQPQLRSDPTGLRLGLGLTSALSGGYEIGWHGERHRGADPDAAVARLSFSQAALDCPGSLSFVGLLTALHPCERLRTRRVEKSSRR